MVLLSLLGSLLPSFLSKEGPADSLRKTTPCLRAWIPSPVPSLNELASLLPSLGARVTAKTSQLQKQLHCLVNLVNVNQCLRTFALFSVQNHPLDLTTSPGCSSLSSSLSSLLSFSPTLFLFPSPPPRREPYTVVQVYLLHVSSTWH